MSAKLFQSIILQVRNEITKKISILDTSGVVIASSDLSKIGHIDYQGIEFLQTGNTQKYTDTYKKVIDENSILRNIVVVSDCDDKSKEISALMSASILSIVSLYDNRYDKITFIKNILLDNILPGDIYIKSNELNFTLSNSKVVFLLRQEGAVSTKTADILSKYLSTNENNFLVHINESDIAVVYDINSDATEDDVLKIAKDIYDTLKKTTSANIRIGYGLVYGSLEEISKSFKESQIALEVGEVFDTQKLIIGFENLGVWRLIYQLPTTLCRMFLGEVFKKGSIESLDDETLSTIKAFFENNLNVSETSRKLFVHRNTLVYRLEKIRKITGLDLREFDHAIVFKVALMVRKYLEARDLEKILF